MSSSRASTAAHLGASHLSAPDSSSPRCGTPSHGTPSHGTPSHGTARHPVPEGAPPDVRIVVALATCNGIDYLPAQLRSILAQRGVRVRVVVADDMSSDGTYEWLLEQAAHEPRLEVLPRRPGGSPAATFYRLLCDLRPEPGELVALADQDDIWRPDKLAIQARAMVERDVDGVSSDVTAFGPDGRLRRVRKSYPQRGFDYLLEGPGPGCTFLLSQRLVALMAEVLADPHSRARRADYHDWLIYALARASGWEWYIVPDPLVAYRQHAGNAMGANQGVAAGVSRLAAIRSSWHRDQARLLTELSLRVAPDGDRRALLDMARLLASRTLPARLALAARAGQLRRRPRDRAVVAALVLAGVW